MRADILGARLQPGQRLMFADLSERYGVSVGVTREALTWLAGQGLVKVTAHQGYMVTPLSLTDLDELTEARLLIEPIVLRLSIAAGTTEWEARVVASHHVLAKSPPPVPADASRRVDALDQWAAAHEAFHQTLFEGCNNERLLKVVQGLAEEAALYRRWSVTLGHTNPNAAAEHEALRDAAVAGDGEAGAKVLIAHISHTRENLHKYSQEHLDNLAG
ncbi:GntR family transcriptional regulator [Nakamurella endophytica]|uniref:GntR family transcriptional regulator n=2 Tax=Nakamurella endophytica TaxID=1748367 RepID=A0A917WE89_9ACTN|nr:GntR family transcriptional regulator [Nakamurella endophytica]